MKKIFAAALTAVAIVAGMAFTVNDPLAIGSKMPKEDIKMMDVSGTMISMKEAAMDNGVLVMFSCNTCPYVIKNQERIISVSNFARKLKVGVIILNSNEAQRGNEDSYDAMKEYAKGQKYSWNYVVDKNHEVADAFGANRTPECFLFDKNLTLVYHGAIDDNPADAANVGKQLLKNALKEMSAGEEVGIKESRSVGCSIKRNK